MREVFRYPTGVVYFETFLIKISRIDLGGNNRCVLQFLYRRFDELGLSLVVESKF